MYNNKLKLVFEAMKQNDPVFRRFNSICTARALSSGESVEWFLMDNRAERHRIVVMDMIEYNNLIGRPRDHTGVAASFFMYHYLLDTGQIDKYVSKARELGYL